MKNSIFLIFIILIVSIISLHADTGVLVEDTVFVPREYYVGDKVELRIKL